MCLILALSLKNIIKNLVGGWLTCGGADSFFFSNPVEGMCGSKRVHNKILGKFIIMGPTKQHYTVV